MRSAPRKCLDSHLPDVRCALSLLPFLKKTLVLIKGNFVHLLEAPYWHCFYNTDVESLELQRVQLHTQNTLPKEILEYIDGKITFLSHSN